LRLTVAALALAFLLGGCGDNQPMSTSDVMATLKKVIGYEPTDGRVIYSWRHCCAHTPTGELIPASRCVVYQFSEAGFKFSAWKHDWSTTYTNCLGPGRMQGCRGFLPGGLQLEIYGQQCVGPEGWIFRIDAAKRIGVVETYTYD
jgi:hypothetical protein